MLSGAIVACGDSGLSDDDSGEVSTAEAEGEASGTLTISNWPFYIDKQTIPDFEEETDITVDYTEDVNDNNQFFGKVQPLLDQGESGCLSAADKCEPCQDRGVVLPVAVAQPPRHHQPGRLVVPQRPDRRPGPPRQLTHPHPATLNPHPRVRVKVFIVALPRRPVTCHAGPRHTRAEQGRHP